MKPIKFNVVEDGQFTIPLFNGGTDITIEGRDYPHTKLTRNYSTTLHGEPVPYYRLTSPLRIVDVNDIESITEYSFTLLEPIKEVDEKTPFDDKIKVRGSLVRFRDGARDAMVVLQPIADIYALLTYEERHDA